jgi:hypothetical protein
MPLVATWCEADVLFGKERVYCHCFFGLEDGSALAFFQFANPEDQALFGPKMAASPFHHIALNVEAAVQAQVEKRLRDAGYTEPQIYILEHGYCRSLYATDPNGMIPRINHGRALSRGRRTGPPGCGKSRSQAAACAKSRHTPASLYFSPVPTCTAASVGPAFVPLGNRLGPDWMKILLTSVFASSTTPRKPDCISSQF